MSNRTTLSLDESIAQSLTNEALAHRLGILAENIRDRGFPPSFRRALLQEAARRLHPAAEPTCPLCETVLDDGYCPDPGCRNCGKTVGVTA